MFRYFYGIYTQESESGLQVRFVIERSEMRSLPVGWNEM